MATKAFNISMDEELVKKIDEAAKAQYTTRSDFLRASVIEKLEKSKGSDISEEYRDFVSKYKKTLDELTNK